MAQPIFTVKYTLLLTAILFTSWAAVAHLFSAPKFGDAPSVDQIPQLAPRTTPLNADDQVDQALQYSLEGKYYEAANILIPLAQQGFSRAQLYLAVAYYHGHGVTRDRKKAEQIFFELRDKNYEPGIVNTYLNLLGSLPASI